MANNETVCSLYLNVNNTISDEHTLLSSHVKCLLCDETFKDQTDLTVTLQTQLQTHLLSAHRLLIADIDNITLLHKYCDYWRNKLRDCIDLSIYCAVINTNCGANDCHQSETYYMLGGNDRQFVEDSELRKRLKEEQINSVINQFSRERSEREFSRSCIFCRKVFTGNSRVLLEHLSDDHNFFMGHADNIVNCKQLLDLLEEKLNQFRCLYCEKVFKSWAVLKEHMRKKAHKMLNPDNREYDKFYLINLLSPEKHWQQVKEEYDEELSRDDCDDWSDWREECDKQSDCVCLFCKFSSNITDLKQHLNRIHKFDFDALIIDLEFYLRIKLINYIRRSMHEKRCHRCQQLFTNDDELLVHLEFSGHSSEVPPIADWDLPEFFFPTYENDNLLHFLDNGNEEEDDDNNGCQVK